MLVHLYTLTWPQVDKVMTQVRELEVGIAHETKRLAFLEGEQKKVRASLSLSLSPSPSPSLGPSLAHRLLRGAGEKEVRTSGRVSSLLLLTV